MTNEDQTQTQALVTTQASLPAVRSIIMSGVDVTAYQATVLVEARQRVFDRRQAINETRQEIAQIERGLAAAEYADNIGNQVQHYQNALSNRKGTIKRRQRALVSAEKFLSL